MLGKLYKHEFSALARSLWPVYLGLFVMAVFNRISMLFQFENVWLLEALQGILMTTYVLSVIGVFMVSLVIVIVRFYQHLMTHQGYLSFTLPVTPTDHVVCKLLCGTAAVVVSVISALVSLMILSIGTNVVPEIFQGIGWFIGEYARASSVFNTVLVVAGFFLAIILGIMASLLMFYMSIAIGQQFKNRVVGAILSFIVTYIAVQILGLLTLFPILWNILGVNVATGSVFIGSGFGIVNLILGVVLVCCLLLSAVYFLVTRYILTNKLNLE